MSRLVALGFTGNYVDRSHIRDYYGVLARRGYPLTFFHPLRVIGDNLVKNLEGSGDELIDKLLVNDVLVNDARNFKRRFGLLAPSLPGGSHVRVVVHTEYAAPFWCNESFQETYLNAISDILDHAYRVSSKNKLHVEAVVEIHPGFTYIRECRVRGKRLHCNVVERDHVKLAQCLSLFRQKLLEKTSIEPRFCIEPRAGSIIQGRNRKAEPQTLSTHREAYIFAKYNNLGLVIDPGQTILKRINIDDAWTEAFEITSLDPNIVDEIHIHSFTARKGRGHGTQSAMELDKFRKLIKLALKNRTRTLGVVLEILLSSTENLIQVASELLKT